jgi:hypothetical protein
MARNRTMLGLYRRLRNAVILVLLNGWAHRGTVAFSVRSYSESSKEASVPLNRAIRRMEGTPAAPLL